MHVIDDVQPMGSNGHGLRLQVGDHSYLYLREVLIGEDSFVATGINPLFAGSRTARV